MRLRTLVFAALAAGLWVNPAPAPPPPMKAAPAGDRLAVVVFQVLSVNHILEDIRGGTKFTGGPALGDKFLDEFNKELGKGLRQGRARTASTRPSRPAGIVTLRRQFPEDIRLRVAFPLAYGRERTGRDGRNGARCSRATPVAGKPGPLPTCPRSAMTTRNAMPDPLSGCTTGTPYLGTQHARCCDESSKP